MTTPELVARAADVFVVMCATIHLNEMTAQSSKCEMCTWWLVGISAGLDFFFGVHWDWEDAMMNVAFMVLAFESTRSHFVLPRFCKFRDRRRHGEGIRC